VDRRPAGAGPQRAPNLAPPPPRLKGDDLPHFRRAPQHCGAPPGERGKPGNQESSLGVTCCPTVRCRKGWDHRWTQINTDGGAWHRDRVGRRRTTRRPLWGRQETLACHIRSRNASCLPALPAFLGGSSRIAMPKARRAIWVYLWFLRALPLPATGRPTADKNLPIPLAHEGRRMGARSVGSVSPGRKVNHGGHGGAGGQTTPGSGPIHRRRRRRVPKPPSRGRVESSQSPLPPTFPRGRKPCQEPSPP